MTTSRGSGDWSSEPGSIVETFHVPQHLMGLAIGAHGANIKAAREIPGVVQIHVRENAGDVGRRNGDSGLDSGSDYRDAALLIVEAKVSAIKTPDEECSCSLAMLLNKTVEAAKQARTKLEYTELYIGVPRRYVGRLIGKRSSNIMSIIKKCRVIHIHFDDKIKDRSDEEDNLPAETFNSLVLSSRRMRKIFLQVGGVQPSTDEEYGGFLLVGTCESVENARLLITFQLDYIWDLEKMEVEKVELMRTLSHTVGVESGPGGAGGRGYPDGRWADVAYRGGGGGAWNRAPPRGGGAAYRGDDTGGGDDGQGRGPVNGTAGEMERRQPRVSNQRLRRGRGGVVALRGGGPPHNYGNWTNQQHRQVLGTNNNGEVEQERRGSRDSDGDTNSVEFAEHERMRRPRYEMAADERQFADGEGCDGRQADTRSFIRGGGFRNTTRSENQFNAQDQSRPNRTGRPPRQQRSQQDGQSAASHNNHPRNAGNEHAPYLRQAIAQVSNN